MLRVTPCYAAVLAPLYVFLSYRVIQVRGSAKVSLGGGGLPVLERRIRVHSNFAEYAPFALLLLAMAELRGTPAWALHALGALLVAGRCAHAWGMSQAPEVFSLRVSGMLATFAVLILGALAIAVG